jgi:hypothetical protein
MPRSVLLRCIALLLSIAASCAHAAPLRITVIQDLAFGAFAAGSGGTVTISPLGSRSANGGVVPLSNSTGNAAAFQISGNAGQVYSITLPSGGALVGNGSSMTLSNFVSIPSATTASSGLLTGGSQMLYVGASLSVAAGQARGGYSGSFTVIIDHN